MIDVQSSINFLSFAGGLTLVIIFTSLGIFGWLAVRYRNIRSFEFQISVFIIFYIVGEILEDYKIPSISTSLPYIGSQIHIVSAVFLAIILWLRLYYVRRSGRKMTDRLEPVEEGDVQGANENI